MRLLVSGKCGAGPPVVAAALLAYILLFGAVAQGWVGRKRERSWFECTRRSVNLPLKRVVSNDQRSWSWWSYSGGERAVHDPRGDGLGRVKRVGSQSGQTKAG